MNFSQVVPVLLKKVELSIDVHTELYIALL